ncbi:hypothetical protein KO02_11530 [Sphingobacterium sp. ML3W]|uniref:hypothetical protein n=1 Tax=Sphingobacterium sp. ML3W TaxID=1538644 RepID=UPI0004F73AEC|nr:hypothetical protein [Sphingobacterium sp. ML3W]AIM37251.1 hypothetical protein KO02_11530 [Sphingobacterium sp. ML3W]
MFFQPINYIRRTVLFYSSIFIILFFTLQGCSKKEHIKLVDSTPISVEIGGYKNLKKNEVTFTSKLTYLNDEKVVDFGWVIKDLYPDESHKETTNETIVSMGNTPKVGTLEYVYKPKSAFELGKHSVAS